MDRKDFLIIVLLWVLLTLMLWPILFAPTGRGPGLERYNGHLQDGRTQWYPWRVYAAQSIREGTLPLWNPYVLCGVPFLGNSQSALFYPPNAIFLAAPVGVAARWSIWFHLGLSLVFMYILAKFYGTSRAGASVAAMAFTFCAAQLLRIPAGHWGVSCAIPWLVLVLLCTEWVMRRPGLAALFVGALGVALQILSGMPQYVFITALAAGLFALIRGVGPELDWRGRGARWGTVAGMFVLGAALGAIQLIPSIEAALHGARSLPMRQDWLDVFSLGPECLLTLAIPEFFGGADGGPYWGRFLCWEMNAYVGVVGFAFALYALIWLRKRTRVVWLAVLALLMLLLALGKHVGLIYLVRALVPFGSSFRGTAKFLLPFSLAMALLAGLGLDALFRRGERLRRAFILVSVLAGVTGVLALLGAFGDGPLSAFRKYVASTGEILYPREMTPSGDALTDPVVSGGVFGLVLLGAVLLLRFLFERSRTPEARKVLVAVVVFVVAADILRFGLLFVGPEATFVAQGSAWPHDAVKRARGRGKQYRAISVGGAALNDGMIEGVPTVTGIEPNPPARFHELFTRCRKMPVDIAPSIYRLPDPEDRERKAVRLMAADVPDGLPRAFVVHDKVVVRTTSAAFKETLAVNPESSVVLEETSEPAGGDGRLLKSPASIILDSPNRVDVSADLSKPGWLVLLDNYFPGWEAEVDGKPAKILRANFAFRAVALPAGIHRVVFRYRPASFTVGLLITCLALSGCVGFAVVRVAGRSAGRKRKAPST